MSSEPAASRAKTLVLDANILVRAVLGRRVLSLLETHAHRVHFLTPEVAYAEAHAHLPRYWHGGDWPRKLSSSYWSARCWGDCLCSSHLCHMMYTLTLSQRRVDALRVGMRQTGHSSLSP